MFLLTTPLACDLRIHHLAAGRAEAHRSVRTPVVHVGAADSCRSQLFSLDSGLARYVGRLLGLTAKSVGSLPASRLSQSPRRLPNPSGIDEGLGLLEYPCALAQPGRHSGAVLCLVVSKQFADLAESRASTEEELFRVSDSLEVQLNLPGRFVLEAPREPLCRVPQLSGSPKHDGEPEPGLRSGVKALLSFALCIQQIFLSRPERAGPPRPWRCDPRLPILANPAEGAARAAGPALSSATGPIAPTGWQGPSGPGR